VILTLEVRGAHAASLGANASRQFGREGGVIGRAASNDWVLPHTKVSGRHARVTFASGVFYIEDTSTNGVFVNSSKERLVRGRPHALESGDRLFIDPYDIRVSISSEARPAAPRPQDRASDPFGQPHAGDPFGADDPFGLEAPAAGPFTPGRALPGSGVRQDLGVSEQAASGQELDPLKLLGPAPPRTPARRAPTAQDLEAAPPVAAHYRPPAVQAPAKPPAVHSAIPEGYDPLADSGPVSRDELTERAMPALPAVAAPAVATPPPLAPAPQVHVPPTPFTPPAEEEEEEIIERAQPALGPTPPPRAPEPVDRPRRERVTPPTQPPTPVGPAPRPHAAGDLEAVLAGAGVEDAEVTEELARDFGRILQVVVSGVMDVLRARQQIKDEFRMRVTQFKPADNNPLKFSANVEDALHNLLVKRNAAYLGPVEAFEDAFDDVRSHQLAMLAGMRVAFEEMLRGIEPDRLQEQFDRQLKKGSLVPAKLRYWELFRDWSEALHKDPEASFRRLFGESFARAYEEQLLRLKDERRRRRLGQTDE
jgi:predicted component of type VI protein secretion system